MIDDCSVDGTEKVMDEYKSRGEVRYFRNKTNIGVSGSRNRGVREAKGIYVAFLDADDWWEKDKLKKQDVYKRQVYVGEDCTWTVTGDSVLTGLSNSGTIVDEDGNTVTVKGSDGTVYVEGTGSYTVTVESYSDSADLSGSSEVTQWSDYQVEKPEALA